MAETKTLSQEDTKLENKEDNSGGKTFTQEEHQAEIDRIAAKTRAEEKAKSEKEIAKARQEAAAEATHMAELSQEQREKELTTKQNKEVEERLKAVAIRENRADAIDKLVELGIPVKLVDFVVTDDKAKMEESINTLKETWQDELSKGIADKLKGQSPTALGGNSKKVTEVVTAF